LDAAVAAGPERRLPVTVLPPTLPPETSLAPELQSLLQEAVRQFDLSQERLQEGDWTGYGEAQRKLKEILDELSNRTSQGAATTPAPQRPTSNGTE